MGKRLGLLLLPPALLAALFTLILFALPPQYSETYLAALQDKMALLRGEDQRPRVLVLGGSAAAFSLRSDLLEEALPGWRVLNLGLYGGLGTAPMLDLALPDIRPGDAVILMPEQNAQTLSGFFGPRAMWQAADGNPRLLLRLQGERRRALVGEALPFAGEKLSFFLKGNAPEGDGVYARSHINAWGDLIAEGREGNAMPGGYDPDMMIDLHETPSAVFAGQMNEFTRACRNKGAQVYYAFCPMNAAAVLPGSDPEKLNAALASSLAAPVLGTAEDSILNSAWFFDTNFHLNAAGAVVYTARLAETLQSALGVSGGKPIALPEPPPSMARSAETGNQADGDRFLYEETETEAAVVGLTEEGKERKTLALPASRHGLPVTALSASALKGSQAEEITLPASLRRIENGAFAGCAQLKTIVLLQENPSLLSVGPDLLAGTKADIIVPGEAYSRYVTNYFWSVHAARLRPGQENMPASTEAPHDAAQGPAVMYFDANGGQPIRDTDTRISFPVSVSHLRTNTALGQRLFRREGYAPLCWNTAADGSGQRVPFGSRVDSADGKILYLEWIPVNPEKEFTWEEKDGGARITGWTGEGKTVAVPDTLGGLHVTYIGNGAFANASIDAVVLPPSLFAIEQGAFSGSRLKEIWLYDSLYYVYDSSFSGCEQLTALHISAATSPRYSVSYFAAFADKLDWLRLHAEEKKLILAGGSATRYAYDSERFLAAFPDHLPVNMGVYAYTNMLPQYRLMEQFVQPGDALISSPEFDTPRTQFCASNALDSLFFAMAEADYACVSMLDLRNYSRVFDSLAEYLHARTAMTARTYEESPRRYDDDGNPAAHPVYNQYGDYVLPRSGAEKDELLQTYLAPYTREAFPLEMVEALQSVFDEFQEKGARVFFAYAPRNHSALSEDSTAEERRALDAFLRAHLSVPFLLEMEDSLYPATSFYLIDNHLSTKGVQVHMDKVVPALEKYLQ